MRKNTFLFLFLSISALALVSPPSATALPTTGHYDVLMDDLPVGALSFRNLVAERGQVSCRYTARWTGLSGPLPSTQLCHIDELKAGDHFDCEQNRFGFFNTALLAVKNACNGFDEFGQRTLVPMMVAGEGQSGEIFGVVLTASVGDVESLTIVARKLPPAHPTNVRLTRMHPYALQVLQ